MLIIYKIVIMFTELLKTRNSPNTSAKLFFYGKSPKKLFNAPSTASLSSGNGKPSHSDAFLTSLSVTVLYSIRFLSHEICGPEFNVLFRGTHPVTLTTLPFRILLFNVVGPKQTFSQNNTHF